MAPGCFRDQGGGMSTDWERYSTPEQTQGRATTPADNGIISLSVGGIRKIPNLTVEHTPEDDNRAHTDVFGDKKRNPEVRMKLHRLANWVIPCRTVD